MSAPWYEFSRSFRGGAKVGIEIGTGVNSYGDGPERIVGKLTGATPEDEAVVLAAPETLEALKLFVRQWNACGPNSDFGRYFRSVRDAAVKAIAKAEPHNSANAGRAEDRA